MRVKFNRRWPRPPPIRCRSTVRKMLPHTISGAAEFAFRPTTPAAATRAPVSSRFAPNLHRAKLLRASRRPLALHCDSQSNLSRRRRTLPSRAPQRTRLLGNSACAYATFQITIARRIRSWCTRSRLAPSARGCEQLTCASNSTVVGRDPRRFDVDIPLTKCRRTRFLGKPEFAFPPDDSSCCHECADLVTICTVASPSERACVLRTAARVTLGFTTQLIAPKAHFTFACTTENEVAWK